MKKLLKKVFAFAKDLFKKVSTGDTGSYIVMAINACEVLKKVIESKTFITLSELATMMIKGEADDIAVAAGREWVKNSLPQIIDNLQIQAIIKDQSLDQEGRMKAILEALFDANADATGSVYTEVSQKLIEYYADGKLSTSERKALVNLTFKAIKTA